MSAKINPDSFNLDIPILVRMRPVQSCPYRDVCDMDIPILDQFALQFQSLDLKSSKSRVTRQCPPTPAYWTAKMEEDSECRRRFEDEGSAEDGWVITVERGKFVGRVDLDEMTA
ncbi:hypothetical protein NliqN6_4046 [Naganishia liquefaciens]|uniref:Uncharacterized protein n=1 Tax=Naganishia liquefaciens TaxID=104408 RepID=A0A8H3TV44_9TREE|nr:hypothetical protein NliqN6_4046 [Naganishia liquefaciens]